jgi:two-component system CheB/CheR fusion protein
MVPSPDNPHNPAPQELGDVPRAPSDAYAAFQQRTRAMLARIRTLASASAAEGRDTDDIRAHFDGRLGAVARFQAMLARTNGKAIDLEEIVREDLLAHGLTDDDFCLEGGALLLAPGIAEPLALAIHELGVNSVKFGALAARGGALSVGWNTSERGFAISWRETGVPLEPEGPRGFGRDFIERGLPFELGAEVVWQLRQDGLTCTIFCPHALGAEGRR